MFGIMIHSVLKMQYEEHSNIPLLNVMCYRPTQKL